MGRNNLTLPHYLGGNFYQINQILLKEEKKINIEKLSIDESQNIETKDAKFKRLANKRLASVVKQLRLLSNLSNKSHYLYKNDEVDEIIKMLKKAIRLNLKKYKF